MLQKVIFLKELTLAIILILFIASNSHALNEDTHEILNAYIAINELNGFSLDRYLKEVLQFQSGISEALTFENQQQEIYELVDDGGMREDNPWNEWYRQEDYLPGLGRFYKHFHNPILNKGLWSAFDSSIKWSFMPEGQQGMTGNFSWHDVETYFYNALTAENEFDRQENYAKTFRGLGQLMHLVQDLSVPEHVRDDGHILPGYYENWMKNSNNFTYRSGILLLKDCDDLNSEVPINPAFINSELLETPKNSLSNIPVANLFDTETYDGTNPDMTTGNDIGLSEYTNANFLSPDTMFAFGTVEGKGEIPYPRAIFDNNDSTSSIYIFGTLDPADGETEKYYSKIRHGEQIKYFLRSYLTNNYMDTTCMYTDENCREYWLHTLKDDRVFANYAQKLIPRAVGYSSQLLEFFFREYIEISLPDDGFYSKTENPSDGFSSIKLLVRNKSSHITLPGGEVTLVIKYKILPCNAQCDPLPTNPPAPVIGDGTCTSATEDFHYIVIPYASGMSIPQNDAVELSVDNLPQSIPINATDVRLLVAYNGEICYGGKCTADGVAYGVGDISEPTPIELINNMDWICIENLNPKDWYEAGSQEAIDQVDKTVNNPDGNDDGDPNDSGEHDIYPHDLQNIYIKISPNDARRKTASPALYDCVIDELAAGESIRKLHILSDKTFWLSCCVTEKPTVLEDFNNYYHLYNYVFSREATAITHQMNWDEARKGYTYRYPTFEEYRGTLVWGGGAWNIVNDAYPPELNPDDKDCSDGTCYCDYDDLELNGDVLIRQALPGE